MGKIDELPFERLRTAFDGLGAGYAEVDESEPESYDVSSDGGCEGVWTITGGSCTGTRPVTAVFVRHMQTRHARSPLQLRRFQNMLDRMLSQATCIVVNRPNHAWRNYSKPSQLLHLARAGFDVPSTLVTNDPSTAREFLERNPGGLVVKGVSNIRTQPRHITLGEASELERLATCPALLQEYLPGPEVRVTVVAGAAIVTPVGSSTSCGPTAHDAIPRALLENCIGYTSAEGLVLAGIDLRSDASGKYRALELNAVPLYTHYESKEDPLITDTLARYMADQTSRNSNIRT